MTGMVALYIFMHAAFTGYEVIARVPVILHTPLMSGSNFIHGIVLVGAMVALGGAHTPLEKTIGFIGVLLAAGNAVGGYVVTERMRPGSVVVDLAAEQGGNCELTRAGEIIEHQYVKIVGPVNLAAELAYNASEMYARNLYNFLKPALVKGELVIDWNDEVFAQSCLTSGGAVKHEPTAKALEAAK